MSGRAPALGAGLLAAALAAHALSYGDTSQDDAFISFRYARNLLDGHGLVFNPGERVEGYTNLSWTLLSAVAQAAGLDAARAAAGAGALAVGALALIAAGLARRLDRGAAPGWAVVAPALLVAEGGLALEAVQGLETALFAALVCAGLLRAIDEHEQPARPPLSAVAFAAAALTRPEGALAFGLCFGARLLLQRGRIGARAWVGALLMGVVLGSHVGWRWSYYGDLVPNTFHVKVGGGWRAAMRGVAYVGDYAAGHLAWFGAAALGGLALVRGRGAAGGPLIAVALVLPWLAYVAAVGGDYKATGRFMHPLLGPLAALAAVGARAAGARLGPRGPWVGGVLAAISLAELSARWPGLGEEAAWRAHDTQRRLLIGAWLREQVPPTTVLAIHSAGAIPYASGLPTIDLWGLTDKHIARAPAPEMGSGMAGHERTDYSYAFGREPELYLPEEGLLTDAPVRLPVPSDFPPDFEQTYRQLSVQIGPGWLNLFHRADWRLQGAAGDAPPR